MRKTIFLLLLFFILAVPAFAGGNGNWNGNNGGNRSAWGFNVGSGGGYGGYGYGGYYNPYYYRGYAVNGIYSQYAIGYGVPFYTNAVVAPYAQNPGFSSIPYHQAQVQPDFIDQMGRVLNLFNIVPWNIWYGSVHR